MGTRRRKPYTASSRFTTIIDYKEVLSRVEPYKPLLAVKPKKAGRNNTGRITVRHQGGGNKNKYRIIDWKRSRKGLEGVVTSIEYDPNRSAFISLIKYLDGYRSYVLATKDVAVGTKIIADSEADIKAGNSLPLNKIPSGTLIHSIEMKPGAGAILVRSAGASATLVGKIDKYMQVRMPSGELHLLPEECYATIGVVSNADHMNTSLGKAGRSRWKNIRPTVRGVAMNPIDHPMGGGEGKTSGGRHPCSPWGQLAKGYKTRKPKKRSNKFIVHKRR